MSLQIEVGQQIYSFLKERIADLPEYRFNLNNIENNALVLIAQNPSIKHYFGEVRNFSFQMFNVNIASTDNILKQLKQNQKIIELLSNEFNYFNLNSVKYKVITVYLNGSVSPKVDWISTTLEQFDEKSQTYLLNIELQIMEA